MFIAAIQRTGPASFGGAEPSKDLLHARPTPLLRTAQEVGVPCGYKHATPNGVILTRSSTVAAPLVLSLSFGRGDY
jgi:hypothetical protein